MNPRKIQFELIKQVTDKLGYRLQYHDIDMDYKWWVVTIWNHNDVPLDDYVLINELSARVYNDYIEILIFDQNLETLFSWSLDFANPKFSEQLSQTIINAYKFKSLHTAFLNKIQDTFHMMKTYNNDYDGLKEFTDKILSHLP